TRVRGDRRTIPTVESARRVFAPLRFHRSMRSHPEMLKHGETAMGLFSSDEPKDDAIALLTEDHRKVQALFKQFESLKESEGKRDDKAALVQQICTELTLHALVEEEIFYPAVRKAIDD